MNTPIKCPGVFLFLAPFLVLEGEKGSKQGVRWPCIKMGFHHQPSELNKASSTLFSGQGIDRALQLIQPIPSLLKSSLSFFEDVYLGHKKLIFWKRSNINNLSKNSGYSQRRFPFSKAFTMS